ncbi:hypothetical protein [Clostridium luticellarii]|jgi:hypothetical protein|nr:hypothetical protein [Clostridium luticellarii]MCI1945170.1 hypothetical protein [Clostridium luticellarii]MCI1968558.1 hypothetical protein [Clostridium luticellarii]
MIEIPERIKIANLLARIEKLEGSSAYIKRKNMSGRGFLGISVNDSRGRF